MYADRSQLKDCSRIVIKFGSKVVTTEAGAVDEGHLGHLAEQVVELTRAGKQIVLVTSGAIRAGRTHLRLPGEHFDLPSRQAAAAVGQILFNLVDNACKYAASAADREVRLEAALEARQAVMRLRDHGPGLADSKRLFQPFSKSAREAAQSAPGVGLGLALSRRLAREMGGDLSWDRSVTDGACFLLKLPLAPGQGRTPVTPGIPSSGA